MIKLQELLDIWCLAERHLDKVALLLKGSLFTNFPHHFWRFFQTKTKEKPI